MSGQFISLNILLKRFWRRAFLTWVLVILEGLALLFLPLLMGRAVDDLIRTRMTGMYQLAALCVLLLVTGAGRRFYDTRVYSGIYREVSSEMVLREIGRQTRVSKISARAGLFTEFIEFLENSLPDIFNNFIGLTGTLIIIGVMDIRVFWTCMAGALLTWLVFWISKGRMLTLNQGQNDEIEKQVDIISSRDRNRLTRHFKRLTGWNIRLSDLETINFSLTWIALAGVLLTAIFLVASPGPATSGHVLAVVMYVFGFIESVMTFPLYYQQMVRLRDIAARLG